MKQRDTSHQKNSEPLQSARCFYVNLYNLNLLTIACNSSAKDENCLDLNDTTSVELLIV
jgi:hypothetical protein